MKDNLYDTFLKLKKISFKDLSGIIKSLSDAKFDSMIKDPIVKEEFLNSYGWKSQEFDTFVKKYYEG